MFGRLVRQLSTVTLVSLLFGCVQSANEPRASLPKLETKVIGEVSNIGKQSIQTWGVIQPDNIVRIAGLTLPLDLVIATGGEDLLSILDMPKKVSDSTFINHVEIGRGRSILSGKTEEPTFVFRYFGLDENQRKQIICENMPVPDNEVLPNNYNYESCESGVGWRASTVLSDEKDHPISFAKIKLAFFKEKLSMIQVEVATQKFKKNESFSLYIPETSLVATDRPIPTTFSGVFQSSSDSYDLSMWAYNSW